MATTRSSPKTDLVRQYLATNPTATAGQIVSDLQAYGISRALAAKVKSRYGKKKARRKPGPKARTGAPAASSNARGAKADAIRDIARSLGKPIRPRDVRAALAAQGIDVSRGQVSQVLRSMGLKRRRRRRKADSGGAAPTGASNSASLSIDDLVAAKKLVAQVGSIEKVKEALAALVRLS